MDAETSLKALKASIWNVQEQCDLRPSEVIALLEVELSARREALDIGRLGDTDEGNGKI